MYGDVNLCTFTGNLQDNPIIKETKNGKFMLLYVIAVNSSYRIGGVYKNTAIYIPCQTIYKNNPKKVAKNIPIGTRVWIQANVTYRCRHDGGIAKSYVYYNVQTFKILDKSNLDKQEELMEKTRKSIEELVMANSNALSDFSIFDDDDI